MEHENTYMTNMARKAILGLVLMVGLRSIGLAGKVVK